VGLYTELFYAIIPTLFLCILLICYPYIFVTFLMFFILVTIMYVLGDTSVQTWCAHHTYVGTGEARVAHVMLAVGEAVWCL